MILPSATLLVAVAGLQAASALDIDVTNTTSIRSASSAIASNLLKSWYTKHPSNPEKVGIFNLISWEWWLSGGAFTALIDYQAYTGDAKWQSVVLAAVAEQAAPSYDFVPPWESSSEANDDQAYWVYSALTALEYDYPPLACPSGTSGSSCPNSYLDIAVNAFNEYVDRWNTDGMTTCNGGLKWQYTTAAANGGFYYKNSVSNGGFFQIAARLARYTGNDTYTMWAEKVWDWSTGVGLVSPNGNVYDGAGDANGLNCTEVNHDEWTYNVGSYMHGAAHMYNITNGSSVWDTRVSGLVNTAIANAFNMSNATGIAYEAKCELTDTCDIDQLSFKGYLARWMAKTTILVPKLDSIIMPVLMTSATAAAQACVGPANNITCGAQWYVPGGDGTSSMPQQMAALEVVESLLIGNAPVLAKLAV